jgi:hypothetical protein
LHLEVDAVQRFGDVEVGHRAEQAAVHTRLLGDVHGAAVHLLAQRLRGGELLGGGLLELGALGFEFLDRGSVARRAARVGIRKLRA